MGYNENLNKINDYINNITSKLNKTKELYETKINELDNAIKEQENIIREIINKENELVEDNFEVEAISARVYIGDPHDDDYSTYYGEKITVKKLNFYFKRWYDEFDPYKNTELLDENFKNNNSFRVLQMVEDFYHSNYEIAPYKKLIKRLKDNLNYGYGAYDDRLVEYKEKKKELTAEIKNLRKVKKAGTKMQNLMINNNDLKELNTKIGIIKPIVEIHESYKKEIEIATKKIKNINKQKENLTSNYLTIQEKNTKLLNKKQHEKDSKIKFANDILNQNNMEQ